MGCSAMLRCSAFLHVPKESGEILTYTWGMDISISDGPARKSLLNWPAFPISSMARWCTVCKPEMSVLFLGWSHAVISCWDTRIHFAKRLVHYEQRIMWTAHLKYLYHLKLLVWHKPKKDEGAYNSWHWMHDGSCLHDQSGLHNSISSFCKMLDSLGIGS